MVYECRELLAFRLDVGTYAAAVTDFASGGCVEYVCKAVGYACSLAVINDVRIVECLYAASARNIVFCCCQFQVSASCYRASALYKSLAECA